LHLEIVVIVSHYPVVAQDSPGFQMKNFLHSAARGAVVLQK
jgi:hypothetical protein